MTLTSSPPSRRELRQQSIAVLPPPSTITRLPILRGMAEGDAGQPVDADVDVLGRFPAPGQVEIAPARRAAADEDGVVAAAVAGEQGLEAVDALAGRASRCPDRGCSRPPRRSPTRAGGTWESGCGSCRRRARRRRRSRIRSPAAPGRARRSATPGPRPPARCACRSSAARAWAGGAGCRPSDRRRRASGDRSPPVPPSRSGRPRRGPSSTRPRRQAGSQGRSQVRPRIPGKTFDCQLTR